MDSDNAPASVHNTALLSLELLRIFSLWSFPPLIARDDMIALENSSMVSAFFYFGKKSCDIVVFPPTWLSLSILPLPS